ncbi:hypothetical protein F4859DRAFT_458140 [Xylaria cf. heliscus]|nr:hypothetical protein F4859DRAFT_458140 [Xylaria cf. heliscus]
MRLLQWGDGETVTLTGNLIDDVPQYAILSHTWGDDDQEVTYEDLHNGVAQKKQGYQKIDFCRKQAIKDGLKYFWIDSCCIKKSDNAELGEAIISMFRWYQNAKICYVYLSDVISDEEKGSQQNDPRQSSWKIAFRNSRWCTRGWTLQELLAPQNVEFFSKDGHKLGSKASLSQLLHERTGIPINAFENPVLHSFSASEKMSWARNRVTRRKEDKAYCLLGLLNISMRISYGEGEEHAMTRLRTKIERLNARGKLFI